MFLAGDDDAHGWSAFVKRDAVLDVRNGILDDNGSLKVYASIQVMKRVPRINVWRPPKTPKNRVMEKLLESGKLVDAVFNVGGIKLSAHLAILTFQAPTLAEIVGNSSAGTEIPIEGVELSIFRSFLRFVYTD